MPFFHSSFRIGALMPLTVLVTAAVTSLAGCSAESIHHSLHHKSAQAAAAPAPSATGGTTYNMQDDGTAWKRSPQMHAFYEASVAALGHGGNVDVDAYEAKSFGIFREFARANHVSEEAMLDHLKLIPRQVVGIVKENPAVLNSYDNFWTAMVGSD